MGKQKMTEKTVLFSPENWTSGILAAYCTDYRAYMGSHMWCWIDKSETWLGWMFSPEFTSGGYSFSFSWYFKLRLCQWGNIHIDATTFFENSFVFFFNVSNIQGKPGRGTTKIHASLANQQGLEVPHPVMVVRHLRQNYSYFCTHTGLGLHPSCLLLSQLPILRAPAPCMCHGGVAWRASAMP